MTTDDIVLGVAQAIADGKTEVCQHARPNKVQIVFLPGGNGVLASCLQLKALNSGDMPKVTCRHLFKVGRGCPFVLSGKTCFSDK